MAANRDDVRIRGHCVKMCGVHRRVQRGSVCAVTYGGGEGNKTDLI